MSHRLEKLGIGLVAALVCALVMLSASKASEQEQISAPVDPIAGLWNMNLNSAFGPTLITMTFNQGGTTVEYDTAGSNSFVSPGESLVQGIWKKTGYDNYTFKEQNFIFNASGVLNADNITTCHLTLSSDHNSFTGSCDLLFFNCSVLECPAAQIASFTGTISATRFD